MRINITRQIEKVQDAQGLNAADARDQINGRVYEARQYLKLRASR